MQSLQLRFSEHVALNEHSETVVTHTITVYLLLPAQVQPLVTKSIISKVDCRQQAGVCTLKLIEASCVPLLAIMYINATVTFSASDLTT